MRITNAMMVSQFLNDANSSLNRVDKYQQQVDSTKKISNISDDPQATVTALRARNNLSTLSLHQSNISTAKSYLSEAESSCGELDNILQTVYQDVVEGAGSGANDGDLSTISDELTSLKNEVVSVGNTTVGSTYLFGGFNFTGTTDASGVKQPPFSVNSATGHLMYNGIDLTKFSCSDDYSSDVSNMASCTTPLSDDAVKLASTTSDAYARDTVCADALSSLKSLLSDGKAALAAAQKFGVDPSTSAGYKQLSGFVDSLSSLNDALSNENSKSLAGDYILTNDPSIRLTSDGGIDYDYYKQQGISVLTNDEHNNCYSRTNAQNILGQINELITNSNTTSGVGLDYSMTDATAALQKEMTDELTSSGATAALATEQNNRAKLEIGSNNSTEYTFTGIDLLSSGKDNIYYIMDKCISLLKSGDTDGLKNMISEVQGAQSTALNLETRVGAAENRLGLISDRYDASNLNYTKMKSDAMDADMAESITNLMTAKTVYNSALSAGAQIVKISLLDFLN